MSRRRIYEEHWDGIVAGIHIDKAGSRLIVMPESPHTKTALGDLPMKAKQLAEEVERDTIKRKVRVIVTVDVEEEP